MKISDHGDDRYRYPGVTFVADFSSNVPHTLPNEALWQYLTEQKELLQRYPEPQAYTLESELAARLSLPIGATLVTSGATEAIYLISQLYSGGTSIILQPTFSEYAKSATLHWHRVINIRYEELEKGTPSLPKGALLWLCNPNNPTGHTYSHDHLLEQIKQHPDTLFVVDQSYAPFTPKPILLPSEVYHLPNCITIHSLTKAYAVPGLRIGYLVANPTLVAQLAHIKMPWSVNALAIQAAHFLLQHDLPFQLNQLLAERSRWVEELTSLGLMEIYPTDTHYFYAQLKRHTADQLKEWLARHRGLLIRSGASYPTLNEYYIRLATQSKEQNDLLTQALKILPDTL